MHADIILNDSVAQDATEGSSTPKPNGCNPLTGVHAGDAENSGIDQILPLSLQSSLPECLPEAHSADPVQEDESNSSSRPFNRSFRDRSASPALPRITSQGTARAATNPVNVHKGSGDFISVRETRWSLSEDIVGASPVRTLSQGSGGAIAGWSIPNGLQLDGQFVNEPTTLGQVDNVMAEVPNSEEPPSTAVSQVHLAEPTLSFLDPFLYFPTEMDELLMPSRTGMATSEPQFDAFSDINEDDRVNSSIVPVPSITVMPSFQSTTSRQEIGSASRNQSRKYPSSLEYDSLPTVLIGPPPKLPALSFSERHRTNLINDLRARLPLCEDKVQRLPSASSLHRYLRTWIDTAHVHLPMIHQCTFHGDTMSSALVLALCAVGAVLRLDRKIAASLYYLADQALASYQSDVSHLESPNFLQEMMEPMNAGGTSSQHSLWFMQANYCLLFFASFSGNPTLVRGAIERIGVLINVSYWQKETGERANHRFHSTFEKTYPSSESEVLGIEIYHGVSGGKGNLSRGILGRPSTMEALDC